ncbi:hypothetical protein D5085_13290 [Ectothiorhodospiraceae bacterium BW-2]|nr:hypothetical protein D5085_13290 [Ectothiorhodospiraceae bacterium BW-2]
MRECGNYVPPEYSQSGSRTLNERGITTEVQSRALTAEELAEKQRQEQEAAQRQAEQERLQREQAAFDHMLLSTYLTADDIDKAMARNISVISGYIDSAQYTIDKLQLSLEEARRDAANLERQGKPVNDNLQKKIDNLRGDISNRRSYIADKEAEHEAIVKKFNAEKQRFLQLKSGYGKSH